jgi:AcrR family transcriptional regulator
MMTIPRGETVMAPEHDDARVRRTRAKVIAVARDLLVEVGPLGLTYTLLSDRTGVTRQTLYRHWPTVEALLVDLVLVGPEVGYPTPAADPFEVAVGFLTSLRAGMNHPTTAAALIALSAQADVDAASAAALQAISADRRAALNALLADSSRQVTENEFARLVGPVFAQRFIAHGPVTDELIADTVTAWLGSTVR